MYTLEEIFKEDIIVLCETKNEANQLLQKAHETGFCWKHGQSLLDFNMWDEFKHQTCYNLSRGMYSDYNWFKKENYKIISFDEVDLEYVDFSKSFLLSLKEIKDAVSWSKERI